MPFSHAVIVFDVVLLAVFGLDFIVISRRNDAVIAKLPALMMAMVLIVLAAGVTGARGPFIGLGLLVLGAALFGYANFLAFVKRGVTFSILSNHTHPPGRRIEDHRFIAIEDRLHEMRAHGWAEEADGRWQLTPSGRRVASLRRRLMRLLRIEAVG